MKSYPSLWHLAQAGLARFAPPAPPQPRNSPRDPLIASLGFDAPPESLPQVDDRARQVRPGPSYNPLAAISDRVFSAASAPRSSASRPSPAPPPFVGPLRPATPYDAPPLFGPAPSDDSLITSADPSAFFDASPARPAEMGDSPIFDTTGPRIDPSAGAFPSVPTLPDSARDFIAQLMQGVTVDPGPAAWEPAASKAGAAPHMPGASASSRPAPGHQSPDPNSAAPSGSRSPPSLRLEIANSAQVQQQLARELGGEMNERVQQQFREHVANPMARLEAQIRAMYR